MLYRCNMPPKKRKEKYHSSKLADVRRGKTRVNIGASAFGRWCELRDIQGFTSHAEVAIYLLDWYDWASKPCKCGRKRRPTSDKPLTEWSSDEDTVSAADSLEDRVHGNHTVDSHTQGKPQQAVTSGDTHSGSDPESSDAAITAIIGCSDEENLSSDGENDFSEETFLFREPTEPIDWSDSDWTPNNKDTKPMIEDSGDEEDDNQVKVLLCPDCGKLPKSLKPHTCEHKIRPCSCNMCGKRFPTERLLNLHNKKFHMGSYKHVCKFCFSTFNTRPDKIAHERFHPPANKPYQCPECPEIFKTIRERRLHIKSSSHLVCHVCGMRFNGKDKLQRHSVVHTGEKQFVCTVCQRSFNQEGHLKSHMRVHTGEKPYQCQDCDKRFNHNVSLKSHIQCHHGQQVPDPAMEEVQLEQPTRNESEAELDESNEMEKSARLDAIFKSLCS